MRQRKLKLSRADREFILDKLEKLRHQVDRAGRIIDHLRTFGRPSNRSLVSMKVATPIDRVVDLLREQLQLRNIQLQVAVADDLPHVLADEAQLEQVLMNLVVNARDAFDYQPAIEGHTRAIRITAGPGSTSSGKPAVQIRVSDTGPGISKDVLRRVFEPFFSTKEVGKGTGLGLSISYALVRDFGGALTVDSSPGKGATFTITLKPVVPNTAVTAAEGAVQ
jgi:histidine kinase